jgi:hypothetical protein
LTKGVNKEKNDKSEKKKCRCWQRYFRFLHRSLFAAQVNGGGSEHQSWRVPISSIKVENKYTRKRRQLRLAKGLDFLEKIHTYCHRRL